MRPTCALLVGSFLALVASSAVADEASDAFIKESLAKPVMSPEAVLSEVQRFVEARLPKMPEVKSATEWEEYASKTQKQVFERVIFRGEAAAWRDAKTKVEWQGTIAGGPGYSIRKLRYEALPGLWLPALLYLPDHLAGKVPVILNVNGHDRPFGKAAPYKQMRCINLARRGMIALNTEWLGMGQLNTPGYNHELINAIDLCGTSGIATHYLAMTRALDILLDQPHADPSRVGVTGLSGGGWQTIFVSAFDTRVTLCDPVAGYSSFFTRTRNFSDLGDAEQTPCDLGTVTDYAPMTAMLAPRGALLTFNARDNCCFAADHALPPLLDAARPIYALFGAKDRLRAHINDIPGTHNYDQDNRQAFYRMIGDQFFPGDPQFDGAEIPGEDEIRSREELAVDLPEDNHDFQTLASVLAKSLPRHAEIPSASDDLKRWQETKRTKLRDLITYHDYDVTVEPAGEAKREGLTVRRLKLKLADEWTVPATELAGSDVRETTILLADQGRKSLAAEVAKHLDAGRRVLAVDPFYLGESHISQRDYLFALLVDTVGNRPVGLQASQLAAIARWVKKERRDEPVALVATGPRTCLAALVAAGIEPAAIDRVELHQPLESLKDVIRQRISYARAPEYFCFGLLAELDLPQLKALVAPRTVKIEKAGSPAN